MTCGLHLCWDDAFPRYDFGPEHPMAPIRLELTVSLLRDLGLLEAPGVCVRGAEPADDKTLLSVHTADYVAAVREASAAGWPGPSARQAEQWLRFGLGTDDVPIFADMHEASARIVAGSVAAALAVWRGEAEHGVNFCGGLHHAMPDRASGFCVYNDVAAAIQALLDDGAPSVAYVDVDVHHGDGTQAMFWDDPRVLTISLHEDGAVLFPGSGFPEESGGREAAGSAVNVALPPGTGDEGWLRAFFAVVPPLLRAVQPAVLVTQHGCDSHLLDPLAHLALSLDAQRVSYTALHDLAHEVAGGRWVATGGGGYEVVDVVPRAWAHLVGIAAHAPVDPSLAVPERWSSDVLTRLGRHSPARMTDGQEPEHRPWSDGVDPDDPLDRAVLATRRAVFPLHGLDPWHD
jgi:acetoin utilization protein AcuC